LEEKEMDVDAAELERRLADVRAKRGYLLPHHGLLALSAPRLLEAYDAAYTALALDRRVLDEHDRELVWLAILIATDEAIATHHIAKFKAAGGTNEEVEAVLRLTALAVGATTYGFVERHWLPHLPGLDLDAAHGRAVLTAAAPLAPRLALLATAPVHACRADFKGLRRVIRQAYAHKVPEPELAEAITLVMFPGSVPYFVEAAKVWLELIRAGEVVASPTFRAWAGLAGQGGYDEAVRAPGHG
jgi:alkylhydroperoxidase/carboxymuconolactone decarboxylase family protein YurZ